MSSISAQRSAIHGRGVFATAPIRSGEVIEVCEVLRVPADQLSELDKTLVYEYYFAWNGDGGIAWGLGSVYNHSAQPNAAYTKDYAAEQITIRALRDIAIDEEITFDYGDPRET